MSRRTGRAFGAVVIVDSAIIATALAARVKAEVRKRNEVGGEVAASSGLSIVLRRSAYPGGRRVEAASLRPELYVVLRTGCVASYVAAAQIGRLGIEDSPIPWRVVVAVDSGTRSTLSDVLGAVPSVATCDSEALAVSRLEAPCALISGRPEGDSCVAPLRPVLAGLTRLFEESASLEARRWFSAALADTYRQL